MALLEDKGYLTHLHTSGGRIPTDLGYRYYVNNLNYSNELDIELSNFIEYELKIINNNVDELLGATAIMLSKISKMFGVVSISGYQSSILTDIELISIQGNRVMLVLAMDTGLVKSIVLNLKINISDHLISKITTVLKESLVGCTLQEIQSTIIGRLSDAEMYEHELVQILVNDRYSYFNIDSNNSIYTSSSNVLLRHPEFQNITQYQKILPALDKTYLSEHFNQNFTNEVDKTLIGSENGDKILYDCSIVTSHFDLGKVKGRIGIIGPKRIPYLYIQNLLNKFTEVINNAY
tara:strand:- start:522 stop:1397 length:876 start_codon:yes stop_codon:yes gene_type:complete